MKNLKVHGQSEPTFIYLAPRYSYLPKRNYDVTLRGSIRLVIMAVSAEPESKERWSPGS